ncbi:MAG: XdhC family protein, partial [Desulfobulbales bacterium]|nr:XdhC family protein [Desulfobulbales bacterium]
MSGLFEEIHAAIVAGQELALATVIGDSGSTPRTSGSTMVIYRDGTIAGTIGGGIIEGDVIQSAGKVLATGMPVISTYDLSQTGRVDDMDLVCGGRMQILIEHVPADRENLEMFGLISAEITRARPFLWIGKITENSRQCQVERAIQTADRRWRGALPREPALQEKLAELKTGYAGTALVEVEKKQYVIAAVQPPDTVYIFGAGHVAKEIAVLTKQVGFRTLVFDDREEFANKNRFPGADGVFVCEGFSSVFENFTVTPSSCIVIVTRGHRFDRKVLAQALHTEAGYIGMIGSRKKRKSVYEALIKEGFRQRAL